MKVLANPENKQAYTDKDIKQFIGLYHLGAINPVNDPVITAIVLEAIHQQAEVDSEKSPTSLKQKILKYSFLFGLLAISLGLIYLLYVLTSKITIKKTRKQEFRLFVCMS